MALAMPSWRVLLVVVAAVLVLAAGAAGVWWWSSTQQSAALAAYADALGRVAAANAPQAPADARAAATRELEAVLARHPSASAAPQAALELGNLRYADRQYERARAAYAIAAARASGGTVRTLARAGVAATWEAERNFAKAVEAYREALAGIKPADFLYEQLVLDLARAQESAGQKAEAVETYRRLLADRPATPRADEIRGRLAALGAAP